MIYCPNCLGQVMEQKDYSYASKPSLRFSNGLSLVNTYLVTTYECSHCHAVVETRTQVHIRQESSDESTAGVIQNVET